MPALHLRHDVSRRHDFFMLRRFIFPDAAAVAQDTLFSHVRYMMMMMLPCYAMLLIDARYVDIDGCRRCCHMALCYALRRYVVYATVTR